LTSAAIAPVEIEASATAGELVGSDASARSKTLRLANAWVWIDLRQTRMALTTALVSGRITELRLADGSIVVCVKRVAGAAAGIALLLGSAAFASAWLSQAQKTLPEGTY
jgi:hypothetical protein